MEIAEKTIEDAIREGIKDGIKQKFSGGYGSPFEKIIEGAIKDKSDSVIALIHEALEVCISDETFRAEVRQLIRVSAAQSIVKQLGSEFGKRVESLKSDPVTKAKIILAIEEIIRK